MSTGLKFIISLIAYIAVGIIILITIFGLPTPGREYGSLYITGKVIDIKEDVIFGGTFTDWRTEIHFENGNIIWVVDNQGLDIIDFNRTGRFHFEKEYFEYDGVWYRFHTFEGVEYL